MVYWEIFPCHGNLAALGFFVFVFFIRLQNYVLRKCFRVYQQGDGERERERERERAHAHAKEE